MRTLLIAGLGTILATTGAADGQRAMQHGPGAGYPVPGRGAVPGGPVGQPGAGFRPAQPGFQHPPQPGFERPGQPGFQRPGQPGFGPGGPGGGYRPGNPAFQPGRPGFRPGRPGDGPGRPGHGGAHWQNRNGRWIGGWNAPGGWGGYRRPYAGWALPSYWVQPGFGIGNWAGYGLAQPPYGYSWSRYYDDAVLIDARGSVYDTVGGIDWDGYDGSYEDGYPYDDRGYDDGLGGASGYVLDRHEDRGRRGSPRYGAGYPVPGYGAGYAAPGDGNSRWVSPDGTTTVTTSGGYAGRGATTTVVVQRAPVVTTTTTEIIEDGVTYTRHAPKVVKRRWRPTKTICRC